MRINVAVLLAAIVSGAGVAQAQAQAPDSQPVDDGASFVVVTGAGGGSVSLLDRAHAGATAGATLSWQREVGQLRYGATAIATSGRWSWAGAALDATWLLLDRPWTPYLGLGVGAFALGHGALDPNIRPALTMQAGVELFRDRAHRGLLGVRALLPVTSVEQSGGAPHQTSRLDELGMLCEAGLTF